MKDNITLINTSRGEVINEIDLINFLKKNKKAKYGTDVIANEIIAKKSSPIINFAKQNQQIIITPHIGGMTYEAQEIAYNAAIVLLDIFLKKEFIKNE